MTEKGAQTAVNEHPIQVAIGRIRLDGDLALPPGARGVVLFAHGSGSSRHSVRNRKVARALQEAKLGTLLLDLLTPQEEQIDSLTAHIRFDIALLAERLEQAVAWLRKQPETKKLPIGLFGASTGAAAALIAAAHLPDEISAVVSRGGRPDLAAGALEEVRAPTLLIVGGADTMVLELNREALAQLKCAAQLQIVTGAGHLFEEPGALERVAELARQWFGERLTA
ncbi:MAG TPA: dienelactone hydrolase family protein [Gemmatimonadaceae bacterium]|nr:dienelactone hydrolase family protein [Gemmatimonadaceae bacterium]